jgi:hypothetical protein
LTALATGIVAGLLAYANVNHRLRIQAVTGAKARARVTLAVRGNG